MPPYTEDDVNYLRSLIYAEGGNLEKLGMYKLGMSIMNRMKDPDAFPDTIPGVINEPKKFAGYKSPRWNEAWNPGNDNRVPHKLKGDDFNSYRWADSVARDILAGHFTNDFGGIEYFRSFPKDEEKAKSSGWHRQMVSEGILATDPGNDETTTDSKTIMQFYSQPEKKKGNKR